MKIRHLQLPVQAASDRFHVAQNNDPGRPAFTAFLNGTAVFAAQTREAAIHGMLRRYAVMRGWA